MSLEVGTHSFWAGVELFVMGSDHSVRVGVGLLVWGRHSFRTGIVLLLLGSARLGIVVFFDDNVHVHVCHEIAQERHGSQSRGGFATSKVMMRGCRGDF